MSRTREEKRRHRIVIGACVIILLCFLLLLFAVVCTAIRGAQELDTKIIYSEPGKEYESSYRSTESYEDPYEADKIAASVIAAIGTEEEEQCFGYSATYVLKVLTAECGEDDTLCWAVATALFNECTASGGRLSPEEAIIEYHWADPADFISGAALTYFCKVFVRGELDPSIGDAVWFYNPMYTDGIPFHESREFVTEINGVGFFRGEA